MSMMTEFREFAVKGNVLDMAVGIIIGVAFGKIVTSLVNDLITPPIGYVVGGVRFDSLTAVLPPREGVEAVTINYGLFLQAIFDFLIVALVIFMVVKGINKMRRKEEVAPTAPPPPPPPREEILLAEIRDLLRKQNEGSSGL